jgi:hypothetical protein
MVTTVDLDPEAYRLAQALAAERRQSIGKILSDAILSGQRSEPAAEETSSDRSPSELSAIPFEHPITTEEIRAMIAEDEEWEITRGDPHHPWNSVNEEFEPGYPRVITGPLGLPEVQLRPPSSSGKAEID